MTVFPSAIKPGCFLFFYRGSGMMCVLHRKWKATAELQYPGTKEHSGSALTLRSRSLISGQIGLFCRKELAIWHPEIIPLQKTGSIDRAVYWTVPSERSFSCTPKLWEPEGGTSDKQKVKLTSCYFFFKLKVGPGHIQALFTSCVTLWDFPQH